MKTSYLSVYYHFGLTNSSENVVIWEFVVTKTSKDVKFLLCHLQNFLQRCVSFGRHKPIRNERDEYDEP